MFNREEVFENDSQCEGVEHYIANRDGSCKTLGIRWCAKTDTLSYDIPFACDYSCNNKITKRLILASIGRIFDPLGLISPLITRANILLQCLWKERLDWDEEISEGILQDWMVLVREF